MNFSLYFIRKYSAIVAVVVLLALMAGKSSAQDTHATLKGSVADATGSNLPGANVQVINLATNQKQSVQTDGSGRYFVNELLPGAYSVSAQANGFDRIVIGGVKLAVAQTRELNIVLKPGQVTQTVEVSADNAVTDTESSALSTVIDNQKVTELPLSNRQFYSLVQLVPGTTPPSQNSTNNYRGGFNVAGSNEVSNNITVNGVFDGDLVVGAPSFRPSVESIQEFKLLTGNYSAEYGRYSGGQLIIVTKSGGNRVHGTAYEYLRNQASDAKPYFTQVGGVNPAFKQNTFGVTLGGPIRRDRTFFFYAYEGQRIRQQITSLATVPTSNMLSGLFWSKIYDPATGTALPQKTDGEYDLTKATNWNSSGAKTGQTIASYFPAATISTAAGATPASNYNFSETRRETMDEHSLRIDHSLTPHDTLFANYNRFNDPSFEPSNSTCGSAVMPNFGCYVNQKSQLAVLGWTHIFSANRVNALSLGFDQLYQPRVQEDNYTIKFAGLKDVFSDPTIANNGGLPYTSVSGYSTLGSSTSLPQTRTDDHYDIVDTFTWVHGAHEIKFGADLFSYRGYRTVVHSGQGSLTFNASNLNSVNKSSHFGTTGNALADLLLGLPYQTGRQPTAPRVRDLYSSYHLFVSDNYKVSPTLTLNYGLRWELDKPLTDASGHVSNFNLATASFDVNGQGGPDHLWNTDYNNFAPRLGLSWQPYGKPSTVLHAAGGIYYNAPLIGNVFGSGSQYPYSVPQTFTAAAYSSNSALSGSITLDNPFPSALSGTATTGQAVNRNFRTSYNSEWSLGVQQALGSKNILDIGYYGSKYTKGIGQVAANVATPTATPSQSQRAYPTYSTITYVQSRANANFNSLQAKLQANGFYGVSYIVTYTYSKSLDNAPGPGSGSDSSSGTPQDSKNPAAEYGLSDFDLRQRLVIAPVAELPFGKGKAFLNTGWASHIAGGWRLSGIFSYQTGRPFTVSDAATNTSGSYNNADRPNQTGDPNSAPVGGTAIHTKTRWFNTSAFSVQSAGTFGNARRNNIIGPKFVNLDTSLVRNFSLLANKNLEFRVEAFNLANHPNFYNPRGTAAQAGSSSLGQIQNAYNQRELQAALRFVF